MSESTSRAERRALRKVAGVEVLTVVQDTHQAIQTLQAGHLALAQQYAADSAASNRLLDMHAEQIVRLSAAVMALEQEREEASRRTVWSRLQRAWVTGRWVTGR